MGIGSDDRFKLVMAALIETGFLLESDPHLPSVCNLVTGEPPRGSWWSHPLAHTIFRVNEQLADHPDVLLTKLVSGKVTFVERQLWSYLFAIGPGRAKWQMLGLSQDAKMLLDMVEEKGNLRTDLILRKMGTRPADAARELEKKLLVVSRQIHTETGAHAKELETWTSWARRNHLPKPNISAAQAIAAVTERLATLNAEFSARATLPWTSAMTR